jgi:hypothetical protein
MATSKSSNSESPDFSAAQHALFEITGLAKIARASLADISEPETELAVRGILMRIAALTGIIYECALDDSAHKPVKSERLAEIRRQIGLEA